MSMETIMDAPVMNYAIAYWLGCLLYISLNEKRKQGVQLWVQEAAFFLIMTITCAVINTLFSDSHYDLLFYWVNMLLNLLCIYLNIYFCCNITPMTAGYYCVKAFILGEFTASLEWQLYYFCLRFLKGKAISFLSFPFFLAISGLVFWMMYQLEKKYKNENKKLKIHRNELLPAAAIAFTAYVVSNLSYAYSNTPFSGGMPMQIFIIRTMADLGAVAALYAYHAQLQEGKVKRENEFLQNMVRMQYKDYQKSEESIAVVNQKYHDLKHAIALLKADISDSEKMKYLDHIEDDIRSYEAQNKTGNKVLDTILTGKTLTAQKDGITITCVADGKELDFITAIDISTLFGNALDNAIEAVRQIRDPQSRAVHLSVVKKKNFLCICVRNPYEGSLIFRSGIPVTTKREKEFHGYGVKSIRSAVEKYGGDLKITAAHQMFELNILIPVPDQIQSSGTDEIKK